MDRRRAGASARLRRPPRAQSEETRRRHQKTTQKHIFCPRRAAGPKIMKKGRCLSKGFHSFLKKTKRDEVPPFGKNRIVRTPKPGKNPTRATETKVNR